MSSLGDRVIGKAPYGLLAAVLAWVTVHAAAPLDDPDVWWHLRLGNDLLDQRSLATPAHWSSYATVSWVPSEPLPEIVAAVVDRVLGLPGVAWLYVATVVAVVVCVYAVCRRRADPLPAAFATTLFVAVAEGSLTPRPQLVSYLFLLLVIETWLRTEADLRPRWWLVPLSWLWSLCHGFWFIGVAYGVLAVVTIALTQRPALDRLLRLSLVAVGSGVVVLLNPIGIAVFEAPLRVSSTSHYVLEWQHPTLGSGPALTGTAMVLVVGAVWLARHRPPGWFSVALVLSALFWDWYAMRTIVLAGLVAAPLLAGAVQLLLDQERDTAVAEPVAPRRERLVVAAGAAACLLAAAVAVPFTAERPGGVPLALDGQLDRLPAGTGVFNDYELGGWLVWRHPDLDQYIDGLITPYSPAHVRGFHRTQVLAPGWYAVVRASGAPVALLDTRSTLALALQRRGWTSSGSDAGWVLLHRPAG